MAALRNSFNQEQLIRVQSDRQSACPRQAAIRSWLMTWMILMALHSGINAGLAQVSREYELKSVFLFNFVQFTEWPTNAFTNSQTPIVIGVVGNNPFKGTLLDTVRGEKVEGREIVVKNFQHVEDIGTCHVLFVTPSEMRRAERILDRVKGKPVLTICDADVPASRNAMIRFFLEENKLRLRINPEAVSTSGLTLSSKLLRAAGVEPAGTEPQP